MSLLQKEQSYTVELKAKPEYHKFLIGRGGANIRKVRENTGARVIFPNHNDSDQETITIIGRESEVKKAKEELQESIKNLVRLGLIIFLNMLELGKKFIILIIVFL